MRLVNLSRLTGSKKALFDLCQYWATDDVALTDTGPRAPAALGQALHACNQARQNAKPVDLDAIALLHALTAAQREALGAMWATFKKGAHVPRGARAEVSYAYDPFFEDEATGQVGAARELGTGLARAYDEAGRLPHEIAMSNDLEWWDGDTLVMPDIKTGYQGHTPHPGQNEQLRLLALAGMRMYKPRAVRIIVFKLQESALVELTYEVDEMEADVIAHTLRDDVTDFARRVAEGSVVPTPGTWCKEMWCPAASSCPKAIQTMTEGLAGDASAALHPTFKLAGPVTSDEEAAYRIRLQPLMERFVEQNEKAIQAYADKRGSVPTEHGPWGQVLTPKETLLATPEAFAVIEEYLGPAGLQSATTYGLSRAGITRAVIARGFEPVEGTVDAILKELRKVNATKTTTSESYGSQRTKLPKKGRAA